MTETHIIGGGFAGLLIAQALCDADIQNITLYEQPDVYRASNAPVAICHPFPGRSLRPHPLLFTAYRQSQKWMRRWATWDTGLVEELPMVRPAHAPGANRLYASWERDWHTQPNPEFLITVSKDKTVQYGPCYAVHLGDLCTLWATRLREQGVRWSTHPVDLTQTEDTRRILCVGRHLTSWFPDLTAHNEGGALGTFATNTPLRTLISGGGHIAPASDTALVAGATRWTHTPEIPAQSWSSLQRIASRLWPDVGAPLHLWEGVRCIVNTDRLPLVGDVPDCPRTYVLGAFGSKGLLWGPYAAHCLAQRIIDGTDVPPSLSTDRLPRFCWRQGSTKPDLNRE